MSWQHAQGKGFQILLTLLKDPGVKIWGWIFMGLWVCLRAELGICIFNCILYHFLWYKKWSLFYRYNHNCILYHKKYHFLNKNNTLSGFKSLKEDNWKFSLSLLHSKPSAQQNFDSSSHWSSTDSLGTYKPEHEWFFLPGFYRNGVHCTLCSASRIFDLSPKGKGELWSFSPWQWSAMVWKWGQNKSHGPIWPRAPARTILLRVQRGRVSHAQDLVMRQPWLRQELSGRIKFPLHYRFSGWSEN